MGMTNWCFWRGALPGGLICWVPFLALPFLMSWMVCASHTVCDTALSESYIFFGSDFSLTVEVGQIAYSKYTLSIDWEEIALQLGINQY